jgi:hypothetical protein
VENDAYKNLSMEYSPQFGQIAVDLGFITGKQLKEVLVEQIEDDLSSKPHRFIGRILFEHGWITSEQINIVLDMLSKAGLV